MCRLRHVADAYFEEGSQLVDQADELWAKAHDPELPPDFRRVARHAALVLGMRARSRFRRHDVALDQLDRKDSPCLDRPTL